MSLRGVPTWLRTHLDLILLSIAASVPVLATAIRAAPTWRPVGDTAAITLRASDVFTTNPPLVGMPTTLSDSVGHVLHHPGPIEFWTIAVAQVLSDHRVIPMLAIVLVNIAAIVAVVATAGWVANRPGRISAALVVALATWSLRGDYLIDPYNPYAAWLPLGAFAVAVGAILAERWWALPIAVVAGSYAAQSHVSLLVPVSLIVVAAVIIAFVRRSELTPPRRPLIASAVALVVCWSPVLLDLLVGRRNVLTLIGATGSDGATFGLDRAWQVLARALTSPPWLLSDRSAFETVAPVGSLRQVVAAILIILSVILASYHWRRRMAVAAALVVAIAGLAGGTLAASRIPGGIFAAYALHNYLWLWPLTGLLWGAVGFGTWGLLVDTRRLDPRQDGSPSRSAGALATTMFSLVAVSVLAVVVLASVVTEPVRASVLAGRHAPSVGSLSDQLATVFQRGDRVIVVVEPELDQASVAMGLVLGMERRGIAALVTPELEASFGSHRTHNGGTVDATLRVVVRIDPPEPPAPGLTEVAAYDPPLETLIEVAQANDAILGLIEEAGGLVVGIAQDRASDEEAVRTVRSGDLVGLHRLGLVISPAIPPDVFTRYANAQEGPALFVRVYR